MPLLRSLFTCSLLIASLSASLLPAEIISEKPGAYPTIGEVERLDPALDALLAPDAQLELLATGFEWAEGPVWDAPHQRLLFSDVPENKLYAWSAANGARLFLEPSGYTGPAAEATYEEGANGLAFDAAGRLLLCQHGNRQVARLAADGHTFEPLAARFEGHRFNSPNDLVRSRHGDLFFTDPPYGLTDQKVGKELAFQGVYRLAPDGTLTLVTKALLRPNGIGLSPDERTLYVGSTDGSQPFIYALDLDADGHALGEPRVFFDGRPLFARQRRGGFDGLKVDVDGHLWATGPGGVLILSAEGQHLGSLLTGSGTANVAFGGADGTTLFITADAHLLRIATRTTWLGRGW